MKSTDWIDEIGSESADPNSDLYWLMNWVEVNIEQSSISHKMQARIIKNLHLYSVEELRGIKKEIEINWQPVQYHGKLSKTWKFKWW